MFSIRQKEGYDGLGIYVQFIGLCFIKNKDTSFIPERLKRMQGREIEGKKVCRKDVWFLNRCEARRGISVYAINNRKKV